MDGAWQILERAGVPCGALTTDKPDLADLHQVVAATHAVLARREGLGERQRVSLLAWLAAWASAFPTSFRGAFAGDAEAVLAKAAEGEIDAGRYLKLRRLARERLLRVL